MSLVVSGFPRAHDCTCILQPVMRVIFCQSSSLYHSSCCAPEQIQQKVRLLMLWLSCSALHISHVIFRDLWLRKDSPSQSQITEAIFFPLSLVQRGLHGAHSLVPGICQSAFQVTRWQTPWQDLLMPTSEIWSSKEKLMLLLTARINTDGHRQDSH